MIWRIPSSHFAPFFVQTTSTFSAYRKRWRWPKIRGHKHQKRRHGVGLLVAYLFCDRVMDARGKLDDHEKKA